MACKDAVILLKKRIKELEAGACRNNCPTQKEAFMAGYEKCALHVEYYAANGQVDIAYTGWKRNRIADEKGD